MLHFIAIWIVSLFSFILLCALFLDILNALGKIITPIIENKIVRKIHQTITNPSLIVFMFCVSAIIMIFFTIYTFSFDRTAAVVMAWSFSTIMYKIWNWIKSMPVRETNLVDVDNSSFNSY